MTKQELVAEIAAKAGVSKKDAQTMLEAFTGIVTSQLASEKDVVITGFGSFRISKRSARVGVNPQNPSKKINIPAMNLPSFKAGKSLKDAVR